MDEDIFDKLVEKYFKSENKTKRKNNKAEIVKYMMKSKVMEFISEKFLFKVVKVKQEEVFTASCICENIDSGWIENLGDLRDFLTPEYTVKNKLFIKMI